MSDLSSPPFVPIEGVINVRDLGLSTSTSTSTSNTVTPNRIRPGLLFRSGELTHLSPQGAHTLATSLNIRAVFDLRSETEVNTFASRTPDVPALKDVQFHRVPVSDGIEYDPAVLSARVASFGTNEQEAFAKLYAGILKNGAPAYETILKYIRDNPSSPCLVHCTAGKDRTGIFAAIVLLLMDVPDEIIIADYHLTTLGLQPALPGLIERFKKVQTYADNWEAFQNMGSARKETMQATLVMIRETYGSAEGYLKKMTSLTDEDITRIRENLRG